MTKNIHQCFYAPNIPCNSNDCQKCLQEEANWTKKWKLLTEKPESATQQIIEIAMKDF